MTRKATLHDVAEAAGVSPSTVSRFLSGKGRMSPETRERIQQAIGELGYMPNVVARGLVQGHSFSIGVMTQDIASPLYGAALLGVQETLKGTDFAPIYVDGRWSALDEEAALNRLMGRVDGIIVIGGLLAAATLTHFARRLPVVGVGRLIPEFERQCVVVDNYAGSRAAMQHLLDLGHRQIAHITGPLFQPDALERLRGYTEALSEVGIPVREDLIIRGNFMEPSGAQAITQLLSLGQPFTAVFAGNDSMALGARLALHQHGLRVPEDVSLMGFDDSYVSAYMMPPLTTVEQPMQELGSMAARKMLKLLSGEKTELQKVTPRLMVRDSVRSLQT
ncbi:LacI family DNA-binding transcriptional regulator [Deinococcus cellulosilyticus]|uniref:LacI family transcriptional regulator n=1 Tax=Deinococcus cellulosilyticus (strain DSM 18568 / NBRC 106333 / KACC 11606 / 5516J-15) TaxID=1223518 RepID=A0A511MZG8_DEIC1|nr:LacI family DNA-binding transcriptional regulator [Deinococcus cellulosilyticus]GEM45658.1 LacI family transcriptional regulator [Deinococcus cellulosilyticus NBRC 106333 = KACC 11606]